MTKAQPPNGAADPADDAGTLARDRPDGPAADSGVAVRAVPSPSVDDEQEQLPRMLAGRYRLEQLIARGGMGRVYLGTQLPLGRRVAVKVLRVAVDEELGRRFFLEASICAKLQHRHIVTVHDYGETDSGELFMVMEYLDGEPLSAITARNRLAPLRVIDIMLQVARALRAAHREGTVHRDLKPGNIMLLRDAEHGEDLVKVVDFGLVKVFQPSAEHRPESDLTRAGSLLGSPRYMAPEQILGETVDARTDVYSFGVVLFTLLAGRAPFVGGTRGTVEVLNQHLRDAVPRMRDVVGDESLGPAEAGLQAIVERCMQKSAMDRYPSMDEVIVDLRNALVVAGGASALDSLSLSRELAISGAFRVPMIKSGSAPPGDPAKTPVRGEASASFGIASGVPSAGTASAPPPSTSASFGLDASRLSSPPSSSSRAKLAVLGAAIVLGLVAGIVYVTRTKSSGSTSSSDERTDTAVTDTPRAAPRESLVRLGSSPPGAEVYLGGERLGTTPMTHRMARGSDGETRPFVFRLPGHVEATVAAAVDRESVDVLAHLVREATGSPATTPPSTTAARPAANDDATASAADPPSRGGTRFRRVRSGRPQAPASSPVAQTPPPAPAQQPDPPRRPALPDRGVRVVDDQPGRRVPVVD
ncbi:MAG: protein kinase [Deltaproteobacteria bacterium]|nr:protein kinase [Deltaproteobacteria bacterium]